MLLWTSSDPAFIYAYEPAVSSAELRETKYNLLHFVGCGNVSETAGHDALPAVYILFGAQVSKYCQCVVQLLYSSFRLLGVSKAGGFANVMQRN
jgi:hypothetical protein